uniref:Muscle M-line assembly protein unc-89 n=1 Tax=Sipha flava TaxID=143950 RepID=A0A2S2QNT5_9HEMI
MGNKCCKCQSSTYSSANATIRSFSSYNSSIVRSDRSHALTFGGTSTHGDSLTTLTMKSSNHSDVGKDYHGGSLSTVGQEDPIPVFLRRLNDLNARVGTRTRLLIELDDASGVQVRWYHNNQEAENERYQYIHEGGFYCLDIVPVTLEDEGLWVCSAQNYAGKSSTAAHLSLIVPKAFKKPIFIEPLRAVLTQRGIVSLECKVIGVPTPKLRWYKDDKEIKAGDIFALTANSEDCLGIYTCEATNVMGTAVSTSKIQVTHMQPDTKSHADSLIPYGPSPKFVKGLKNVTEKVGNALILECQVEIPPWPRSVGWYNDAGIVNEGPLYHLIADGMGMYGVEIKSLRADHSTTWKCVVTSLTGVKAVTSCLVTVSYPKNYRVPRFLESLRAIMTDEGLVSFECKVIGYPTPQLSWFKDGKQLQPGDVYELTGSKSLGSYCCVARNCMGETSSLAELTMEDIQNQLNESEKLQLTSNTQPPRFLLGLKSAEANINESFVFMIKVTTESTPLIKWYKEDEELTESNRYQFSTEDNGIFVLNILPLEINDQAEWKCVAVNKYGQTVTSSFLKLNIPKHFKPPKFLEELRIAFSNEGSVNLECKVIGVPQPQLKWFKDGQELNPGDMHKIISGQSGTCCLGTYTCQAHNCMGTVTSSATLLTMEDKSTVKSCASEEYLSVGNQLVRNESLSTIPEERTSQMEKSYTIEEPADVSFSFDGKEVTVSLYETPDLTHDEALQIIEMYADELSEHISEDNVVDLPSLRIVKESSISGPVMMEALVIDVPIDFCQQQPVSDTQFDGVSLTEDTTLANIDKSDSLCENSLEYFSDHFSSSNSKRDIFFSVSETTPKNASVIQKQQSEKEAHQSVQTPKLFMSDSDDQILTQLNLEEKNVHQTSRNPIGPLARSESNNTEEEVSETLADIENEQPLPHNYCAAEILTQSDEDGLYSAMLNKIRNKGVSSTELSSEEDDVLKIISRPNVDEFLKYMKIILEGTMVKMHTHESFNYTDSPTELERSIQALHSLAWKFIEETEKDDMTELDKNTTENVSSLMTAINASLLALEQIDDPFGVSDNVLNEIQSSVCFDFETFNNKDLSAIDILKCLSDQIRNFTTVVNRQVAQVTEQRIMAVLRNTIGTTLVYIKTLQQNSSKIKCINVNSLVSLFSMVQPLETILNDIAFIEEASVEDGKCNHKLKQMLIPPISSIAFSLDNLNMALKNENSVDDQDLKDIYSKINDATNQFMILASQGTETNNLAECFISFTKPINDLCCHLRRLGRSTENIISSDYGSDDKLLMDFETLFDELMMDIDTLINNVNIVRDSENNMNPLGSLLEPLQDMKIGLFQVNQVLLSNQTSSNMSYEVISCFEHLSHQLVQLNSCIINQSIIEETDKEIPFESSIKMMQNILFDDAIDDLGVNGILFGSVLKPLLHLQNLIVSKMASVESDLSFSEHTDATGGAQSLSLSMSNNAQTVFNKPEKDKLVSEIVELSGLDNMTKEYDDNNAQIQASSSKIINDFMLLENNEKSDLVPKPDFKFDIEERFKDEEPSIIMTEDDRENSGFEVLFDETDLETFSDFIEDERSNKIVFSENKPLEVLMDKSGIDSINEENDYNVIPQHVLTSFEKGIELDSILNSSDDLFDEIQETLKNITEATLDETIEMNSSDENSQETHNLQENSSYCSEELISQIDKLTNNSLDENEGNCNVLIKQDRLQSVKDITENCQNDGIILELEQDDTFVNKYTDVCNNDTLKINQIHQVSEIIQDLDSIEEIELVDSDKTISNNTIITNNEISDSLEMKTVKSNNVNNMKTTVDDAFTSSTVINNENTSKREDFLDQVQDGFIKINNDQLEIENTIENSGTVIKNLDFNNEISKGLLKTLDTIEFIESKNDISETIHSQDIKSSEKQKNKFSDFLETNKVSDNVFNQSKENIVNISHEIEDCDSSMRDVTDKIAVLEPHVNTTLIENFKELIVLENGQQKLDNDIIEEINTAINSETENKIIIEGRKSLFLADNNNQIELNTISIVNIDCKNENTTEDSLMIRNVDTTIVEESPNEIKQCVSNLNDNDKNDTFDADTFTETFDQSEECISSLNHELIIISKNKSIIDECNILKENVILRENKFDEPFDKDELLEDAGLDGTSEGDFQESVNLSSTTGEKMSVPESSELSLIMCSDKENTNLETDINSNEDDVLCSSNKIENESIMKDKLKNIEQISFIEEKSFVNIINGTEENKIEESNKKCKILSNVSEIDKNVDLKLSNIEDAIQVVNLEVPKEELNVNNELLKNISNVLMVNKLINTENNETEIRKIPSESYISNIDNGIKEVLITESKHDSLNKFEFSSDLSMNQEEIFSNEMNKENYILESTTESKNSGVFINVFDKSIEGLEQASVSENNNAINDRVCEFQNKGIELIKEPLLLTIENIASINNEIIASESIQLIDQQQFEGNEIEVKYEDNRKDAIREKEIILGYIEDNKNNSEQLETKDRNGEEQIISKNNNLKKEVIKFRTDSLNVPIAQNMVLECEEDNSTEFVRPIKEVIDNNFKIIDKKSEQFIENLIHEEKDNEQEEKNEPNNESLTENNSAELNQNYDTKEINRNVTNEKIEIQTLKSNDEKVILATNIKDKNVTRTDHVEKKLTTKPKLYYESGIEACMTENQLVNSQTDLESTNISTEKDKCVDIIHSYDSNDFPLEENIEYNSINQRDLISNQNNIQFNNTETIAVDFTQATKESKVCNSYLDENNVNQYPQVTESQTVNVLENASSITKTQLNEKSTQINTINETESKTIEENDENRVKIKFNKDDDKSINDQSSVSISIDECKGTLNENILDIDETKSLSPCNTTMENVSEIFTEKLVDVIEITEMNVLESLNDNDKNIEKIKENELNTENIKKEVTESKNLENISMINDTSLDATKNPEETNVNKPTNIETNVFESTKIEYLLDNANTSINFPLNQNSPNEYCISKKGNDTDEKYILNQSTNENNELEHTANLIKLKSDNESNCTILNDQGKQEIGVIVINNDDKQCITDEFNEMTLNKNEINILHNKGINKRVNVSDLEIKVDLLCESLTEDEIIDLVVDRDLNDLAIKPKLHYIEQNAANQTECIALENANILKQNERSSIENITEHAKVEHELNTAVIGDMVMNYDSVKENSSNSLFDLCSLLETAIIDTIDEHSNKIVMKNIDILKAPNANLTINNNDSVTEKESSGFIDDSMVINEENNRNILTSNCVKNENEKDDELNKENKQIKKEVIQKCPVKLESDEDIFKEPQNNDVSIFDTQQSLNKDNINVENLSISTDIICPLNDNNTQAKENEPTLNVTNDTQDIKITNKETTKETDNKKNIKQSLSLQSNKSPPDIIENFNESKEKNQFVCEIEEATKKLSNDKKHEFEIKSQDIEETNKNISLENVKKVSGGIEKVNSNESNENQIENQKSSQVDSNQIKPMNDEKFTDKKRQGSKKKKASTQTLDKKLLTPNKLLENSESKSKTDEEMKTIDSKTEDSNRYLLENHEKVIKIESNLELNSLEKSNTIISIASNNKDDKNVVEETEKNVENDERTENHKDNVFDEDKMQLVKNEVDIDKTIQENKHTRLQHQDEQLSSLDELLENNKEEKEKLKIIESTTEENSKQHTKDKEKMKEIDSKLEEVLVLKNNENTLKELQNINNDTNKNILNNEQKEKNKFEINKKILMKKESDTNKDSNKEKRDIKKKKKSPLSPTENLASSDELMAITNRDEKIEQVIEVKPNTDFDGKNNENISSNKLSDMAEKETNETNKTDVSIMPNEIILDNVKQTIQILKEVIPENNTTDIFKINDENKNEPKKMDMDKNAIENSSTNQDNINEKIKYEILSEKSLSLENLVRTANVETDKKWKNIDTKENDSVEDERKREMKCVQRVDSCLDVTKLENSNRDKNKRKNSESKKSKGEQVKCFEENKMKRENKEVVQPIRVIPRKSSVEETTAEIRVTKEDSNESYDKNLANQIGRIKSFDTAEKQTVLNDGERHGEKCFAEITAKDEKVASGKWTNHINTVTKIFDAPVARRRNFETRSPTPCHGYEDHGVSNITKITASARSEELLSRGKDASPRYLTVTDAYRSRQTPLTYRSFTPETSYRSLTPELSRFSELTKTYAGTTGIGGKKERYRGDRSFSSYAEPVRPANKFYERNLSPVNAMYRSPSEMTLRTHHRLDDDDISWYSRSRRRVSDSFLHRSDSWDNYSNRKWSVTKDDLDRTKETFKRLYFCVRLMDQTVSSGTRVKFWCSIIGYPEPRVQWYRDGQKLNSFTYNSSARYQTKFTNGLAQLIIDNAQSGDSGEYTCVAVNSGDRISTTAFLTVYTSPTLFGVAPKRSLQPASLSADGFKSTSLDRLYQWSGDDLRRNFRITSDWRSCNDVLRYPKYPKIVTTVITDDITTYGGTIALQVRVQGSPFPTVSWMWQSRPLPRLSTKYVYLDEGELHTLLVKDSTARDGGTYVCRACNLYGTANVEKTVKVVSPQDYSEHRGVKPAVIVSRPNDRLNVAVGEDITVTLRVAGEPKPKVVWMRGWRDVTFLNRSLKETVNDYVKLSIKKAQLSDAGTYFIIAKNVYGSDRAFVTVGVSDRISVSSNTSR